jgi:hypothetical protein
MLTAWRIISQDFQNLGVADSVSQFRGSGCHNCAQKNKLFALVYFTLPIRTPAALGRPRCNCDIKKSLYLILEAL